MLLFMSMSLTNAYGQHPDLMNWYDTIKNTFSSLRNTENILIKKEVLYNGSIIPVAQGNLSYCGEHGKTVTIPFIYSYGRIVVEKSIFERMISEIKDSSKVSVYIAFQPIRISYEQKKEEGLTAVLFDVRKRNLNDLYLNNDKILLLKSYWAIAAIDDCYKVSFMDYSLGGWYYHIPYKNKKKIRLEKKAVFFCPRGVFCPLRIPLKE